MIRALILLSSVVYRAAMETLLVSLIIGAIKVNYTESDLHRPYRVLGDSVVTNSVKSIELDFCIDLNIRYNILATNVQAPSNQQSIVIKINYYAQWTMLLSGNRGYSIM